jgi:ParB/RepB/Spo0J family partition protein
MKVRLITRSQIHPDPEQPRQQADAELRDSIARNGLLQPITVRSHPEILTEFMIVDGERRWRSCEGVIEDLPCIVRGDMDEVARRIATQLEANTGKPLTALEEARAFLQVIHATGMNIAELAEFTGRPKSTIAERSPILELGPWVPLIESGDVVLSHAVKVLLPLRTVPDTIHEHAIELLRKDYRFEKKGQGRGISLGDFENLIQQFYTPSMYPLNKSKSSWAKQPEFKTTAHDQECDCGGIKFDLGGSGGGDRLCCGNPGWWRPLHRKALAAKKPAKDKAEPRRKVLHLPEAAKYLKTNHYGEVPSGVTQLTDSNGVWNVGGRNGQTFDPADLTIDDAQLVAWESYGSGFPCVGTRDAAAVKAARAKWDARWSTERTKLVEKLRAQLEPRMDAFRLEGAALATIGGLLNSDALAIALDVAEALGWSIPESVTKGDHWNQDPRTAKWIQSLTPAEREQPADRGRRVRGAQAQAAERAHRAAAAVRDRQHREA